MTKRNNNGPSLSLFALSAKRFLLGIGTGFFYQGENNAS